MQEWARKWFFEAPLSETPSTKGEGFILRFIGTMQSLGLIRVFDFVGF
jgi:hypothetical protein